MKKVCMIVPGFDVKGGIASVVSGYRGSELEERYQIHYVQTYCDGGKGAKLCKALGSYAAFARELICFKPDLIHVHSSFGASFYRKLPFIWLASALHIPVVNHVHGSEICRFYHTAPAWEKRLKKNTFSKCDQVIVLSDYWKERLSCIVEESKISVIPNYGNLLPTAAKSGKNHVLFMGFLSELKGCFDIPKVAAIVSKRVENARFILAGSGTQEDRERILDEAGKACVQNRIELPGWVRGEEKCRLLEEAALFFLPSYTEGMPMSILEAMGYGLPIVSSNVGGIPQLVTDGENGFLCKPGDAEGFAEAIIRILEDEKLRSEMGEASRKILRERYSLKHHTDELARVYESLM